MKPIQIHVVRTVVQRLIEDCTAAVTESERTRDMVTTQQGAATPALRRAAFISPTGGRFDFECVNVLYKTTQSLAEIIISQMGE